MKKLFAIVAMGVFLASCGMGRNTDPASIRCYSGGEVIFDGNGRVVLAEPGRVIFHDALTGKRVDVIADCAVTWR